MGWTLTVEAVDNERKLIFVRDISIGPANPFVDPQVKRHYALEQATDMFFAEISNSQQEFVSVREPSVYISEILENDNPRINSPEMRKMRCNETKSVLDRAIFKVVLERDLPDDVNLMPSRFLFAL